MEIVFKIHLFALFLYGGVPAKLLADLICEKCCILLKQVSLAQYLFVLLYFFDVKRKCCRIDLIKIMSPLRFSRHLHSLFSAGNIVIY